MHDPSLKLSYDEYVRIFNELIKPRRVAHCLLTLPEIFNNSYTFKKGGVLNTLGIFKPKGTNKLSMLVSIDFNPKDFSKSFSMGRC